MTKSIEWDEWRDICHQDVCFSSPSNESQTLAGRGLDLIEALLYHPASRFNVLRSLGMSASSITLESIRHWQREVCSRLSQFRPTSHPRPSMVHPMRCVAWVSLPFGASGCEPTPALHQWNYTPCRDGCRSPSGLSSSTANSILMLGVLQLVGYFRTPRAPLWHLVSGPWTGYCELCGLPHCGLTGLENQ